jgi:hypothetical protein
MNSSSSRVAASATTNGKIGVPIISMLVALAFGVAIANFIIGQRVIVHHSQHSQQTEHASPTIEQRYRYPKITGNLQKENQEEEDHVYDGKYITQILTGEEPFPSPAKTTSTHDIGHDLINNKSPLRLKYQPGTLHLTHAQALQHCFVNATHYSGHIQPQPQSLVSISHKYKLIYRNIVKSSSSSARHVMQDYLKGRDLRMKHVDMLEKVQPRGKYTMISFIREPLNRFYSSYDEAYFR